MTPAIAAKVRCERCGADLPVGMAMQVNGSYLLLVKPCPRCEGAPGRPPTGTAAPTGRPSSKSGG